MTRFRTARSLFAAVRVGWYLHLFWVVLISLLFALALGKLLTSPAM
jgi:hypothetical protein